MVRPDGYVDATLGVTDHRRERRRRLTRRGLPLLAVVSLVAGLVVGARSQPAAERAGHAFAVAWQHGDLGTMYSLLTPEARSRTNGSAFAAAYRQATATATLRKLVVMHVHSSGGRAVLDVAAHTRAFGTVRAPVLLPVSGGKIDWRPNMTFPGVPVGGELSRRTTAPPRASILARDGVVV